MPQEGIGLRDNPFPRDSDGRCLSPRFLRRAVAEPLPDAIRRMMAARMVLTTASCPCRMRGMRWAARIDPLLGLHDYARPHLCSVHPFSPVPCPSLRPVHDRGNRISSSRPTALKDNEGMATREKGDGIRLDSAHAHGPYAHARKAHQSVQAPQHIPWRSISLGSDSSTAYESQ